MKKTVNVNIKGIIFNIEEDAYERLKNYLQSIKNYFSSYEDSNEIYDDIESRIGEILYQKINKSKNEIISIEDVDVVIATMGNVDDFAEHEDEYYEEKEQSFDEKSAQKNKRFYKDSQRKIISGVCAGIGHYFNLDPFWIRILFVISPFMTFGAALLVYIILVLILPSNNTLSEPTIKRLYRDGEEAIIGGVASGIAKYFGTDPVWIRILFILSFFLFGSGPLIYFVIWIITPEAKTRSEKMQMEGEPITIHNIEKNLKENLNLKDKEGNESTLATILLFPFRLIAQILNGLISVLKPISGFLLQLFRLVGGVMLVATGFAILISFILILAVGIGLISSESFQISGLPVYIFTSSISNLGLSAMFFSGLLPAILLILLGLSLFAKKIIGKPLLYGAIFGFWLLSVGVLAGTAVFVANDFKEEEKIIKKEILPITDEVIYIGMNQFKNEFNNVELTIKSTLDSSYKLETTFSALGTNATKAIENAKNINYNYNVKADSIVFDQGISLRKNTEFRNQKVKLTLYVPQNKKMRIDKKALQIISKKRFFSSPSIYSDFGEMIDFEDRIWISTKNEFICQNCDDIRDKNSLENQTSNISTNQHQQIFNVSDFTKIEINHAFEIEIIESNETSVTAIGSKEDIEKINIETDNNWLKIDYKNFNWDIKSFNLFNLKDNSRAIKIQIKTPFINELNISGAVLAKANITHAEKLKIDLSGASKLNLATQKITDCIVDVSGASTLNLTGKCEFLAMEVSGASQIDASKFECDKVVAEASGASSIKVYVKDELDAEVSGVSSIKYKGDPKLIVNKDQLSYIEKL